MISRNRRCSEIQTIKRRYSQLCKSSPRNVYHF